MGKLEIIVPDPSYDHEDQVDRSKFLSELDSKLATLSPEASVDETNLGRGADWPAFLIVLGGLLVLGKPLNENLEAWLALAKKANELFTWILTKCVSYRVDENGATLIALSDISSTLESSPFSIDQVSSTFIPFLNWDGRPNDSLCHHPDGIYIQTYVVNSTQVIIYGIKSTGNIESKSVHAIEAAYG